MYVLYMKYAEIYIFDMKSSLTQILNIWGSILSHWKPRRKYFLNFSGKFYSIGGNLIHFHLDSVCPGIFLPLNIEAAALAT